MTFFSVLLALIAEQVRALSQQNPVSTLLFYHAQYMAHDVEAGQPRHRVGAWLAVTLPWTIGAGLIYFLLYRIGFVLAFAWNVAVLYFTLGFRQFSHYFTDIHVALNDDDVLRARSILREWTGRDTADMPVSEIVRHTLLRAVVDSHRHVFGVFFWFVLPLGPAGAVLYRVAEYLARVWGDDPSDPARAMFARAAFSVLDWVPARLTALGFAIVGNFEDAMYAIRHHRSQWTGRNDGLLLAAASGALGARLIVPLADTGLALDPAAPVEESVLPVGVDCTPRTLQSAVGLVWRAVILWMILLLLMTLAVWVG
jgi:adenosylcobinamide-phosphate synthase